MPQGVLSFLKGPQLRHGEFEVSVPSPVTLAPPGAGLPWVEAWLSRYWYFPSYCRRTTWEQASAVFARQGERLLALSDGATDVQLTQQVLIPRLRGLEDSSRYWSLAMTAEHLVIVGRLILRAVTSLSRGEVPTEVASTAAVKPRGEEEARQSLAEFRAFQQEYLERTANAGLKSVGGLRYRHPWFGLLTAHQWHCLAGVHQGVHRKQMEAIRKGLGG